MFSNVLISFPMFSDCSPTMLSYCWNPLQAELNYLWWVTIVLRMISDDLDVFRCSHQYSDVFRLFSNDVFRLLKSSSSWTKSSMIGPQLRSGWYQMILDVFRCCHQFSDVFWLFSDDVFRMISDDFRCFAMFSDVFSWVVTFMDNHPLCTAQCADIISQDALNWSQIFYRDSQMCSRCAQMFWDVHRCSQMFSDDHRCFWIFSRYSVNVLLMFSRCSLEVLRMFAGFF